MKHLVFPLNRRPLSSMQPGGDLHQHLHAYPQPNQTNNRVTHPRASRPPNQIRGRGTTANCFATNLAADTVDVVQLQRLAHTILSKEAHDLEVLAANNPDLVDEWMDAFGKQRETAEKSVRTWASAAALLETAKGFRPATCQKKTTH